MGDPAERLEVERLRALQETGLLASIAPRELQDVCGRAKARFRTAAAMFTLVARETLVVSAKAGADLEELPRAGQFCDHTIRSEEVFVVDDAARDPRFSSNPMVTEGRVRFYAGAPLIYRRGVRLGALCLLDARPREFSLGDRAELEEMADEAVSVVLRRALDGKSAFLGLPLVRS